MIRINLIAGERKAAKHLGPLPAAQKIAADEVWRVLAKDGLLARLHER